MLTADRRHRDKFAFNQLDTIVLGQYARIAHPVVLVDRQQTALCGRITGEHAQLFSVHAALLFVLIAIKVRQFGRISNQGFLGHVVVAESAVSMVRSVRAPTSQ